MADDDDRLERLERRVTDLESVVRLLAGRAERPAPPAPAGPARPARPIPPVTSPASPRSPAAAPPPAPRPPRPAIDHELWLGQRGLLAVGVVAVVLAAGFFLRLAFDRGWISPFLRCLGGVVAGAGLGALGWRLHGRGTQRYGAALIGGGAAIIYLAVWAAARLYGLVPPAAGLVGLALVSVMLALIAFAIDIEWLAAIAVVGAFLAPPVVGREDASPDALLIYVGAMAFGLGWVGALKRWRVNTALVTGSLIWYGVGVTTLHPNPWLHWVFAVVGSAGALAVTLRAGWVESRLLAFGGGWSLLAAADRGLPTHWPTVLGAIGLAAPIWHRAWRAPALGPSQTLGGAGKPGLSFAESVYFLLTPIFVGGAIYQLDPARFDRAPGLDAAIVGAVYLVAGLVGPRPPFALVGFFSLLLASLLQWNGLETIWVAAALGLGATAAMAWLGRIDARWYAGAAALVAAARLLDQTPAVVGSGSAAFFNLWFAALITTTIAAGLAARYWPRLPDEERASRLTHNSLWILTGLLVFGGVTHELEAWAYEAFGQTQRGNLVSGLSVSAWWILFAAGLVVAGFRRDQKPLRWAGLGGAALTVLKVVAIDLSELDSLYRVASMLIVGIVSLALAYLYQHRTGKRSDVESTPS